MVADTRGLSESGAQAGGMTGAVSEMTEAGGIDTTVASTVVITSVLAVMRLVGCNAASPTGTTVARASSRRTSWKGLPSVVVDQSAASRQPHLSHGMRCPVRSRSVQTRARCIRARPVGLQDRQGLPSPFCFCLSYQYPKRLSLAFFR